MKPSLLAGAGALVAAIAVVALWPGGSSPAPAAPVKRPVVPAPLESVDLALSLEQKSVVTEFTGNGREQLRALGFNV